MTITYFRDIPVTGNDPSVDQPDMTTNTNSIDDFLAIDHIPLNSTDFQNGYHNVIRQPPQNADPAAIPGIGQTYVKTVGGDQELFYESGNGVVTQLTISNQSIIRGSIVITTSAQTLTTLPADCVGMLVIQLNNLLVPSVTVFPFITDAGAGYIQQTIDLVGSFSLLAASFTGLDIKIQRSGGSNYSAIYKIIYWNG